MFWSQAVALGTFRTQTSWQEYRESVCQNKWGENQGSVSHTNAFCLTRSLTVRTPLSTVGAWPRHRTCPLPRHQGEMKLDSAERKGQELLGGSNICKNSIYSVNIKWFAAKIGKWLQIQQEAGVVLVTSSSSLKVWEKPEEWDLEPELIKGRNVEASVGLGLWGLVRTCL